MGAAFANHENQVAKVLLDHRRGMRTDGQHNRGHGSRNDDCAKGMAPELLPFEGRDPFRAALGQIIDELQGTCLIRKDTDSRKYK
ncbi:hypothetical protein BJN34_14560 [Cupriavidus necator]|uniref:Uncharacterized protein n=1 Tax=Cupriavidus necator TaxID=106590 RepID=A0A1U9URA4_CUPNE|nr:hypothetical protein BJN34_14560 [Cupriavidus necator]